MICILGADSDPRVRVLAARSLGRFGDVRTFDILLTVLQADEDAQVRDMAAHALANVGDRRAIPVLEQSVANDTGSHPSHPWIRVSKTAAESIRRIAYKQAHD